jgi:AcrR family transcriptional regulator
MRTLFALSIVFAIDGATRQTVPMATRRERLRSETIDEIKAAALARMAAGGAPALSLRGVARDIGMSPAGLYRYYDGIDALLTDLITDAYRDLADAVEAATTAEGDPFDRIRDAVHAYRDWALAHPERFLLIFGTPIPGYAAPEEGPTVAANRRLGAALFAVGVEAAAEGRLAIPHLHRPVTADERAVAGQIGGVAPEAVPAFIGMWARFHGLVILEVTNQLHWLYPEPEAFFSGEVRRMVDELRA